MFISTELWRKFKNMKQEILDLKQTKKASCASKYFTFTLNTGDNYYTSWKITYKAGTQPIIAEVLSYSDTALSAPVGDIQYLFAFSQSLPEITVLSTREIEKIEGVS